MIYRASFVIHVFCPIKCPYCPQDSIKSSYKGRKQMSFDDFQFYLSKIPKNIQISFSGTSENWLNKDCAKMIHFAYYHGWSNISITHVGYHMTFEDIELIKNIKFSRHTIHLPSALEEMNGIEITDDYIKKLKLLQKNHSEITYNCFGDIHPKLSQICSEIKNDTPELQNRANSVYHMPTISKKRGEIVCLYNLYRKPYIYPDGNVVLCCQDWTLKHILGNLNQQTISEIYNGPEFQKIINAQKAQDSEILCRNCYFGVNLVPKKIDDCDTLYGISGEFWSYMYNSDYNSGFKQRNPDPDRIRIGDTFICAI